MTVTTPAVVISPAFMPCLLIGLDWPARHGARASTLLISVFVEGEPGGFGAGTAWTLCRLTFCR